MCMKYFLFILCMFVSIAYGQVPKSEIIIYKSHNKIEGDKLVRTDTVVLQINERAGVDDAKIGIRYAKGDKLSIQDVWIEDLDGKKIRKLKKNEIQDRSYISEISMYEDDFIKTFELRHNIYPYRIVYSYRIIESKFHTIFYGDYARSLKPIRSATVIVETDINRPIKFRQENIDDPKVENFSKKRKYTWEFSYDPPKFIERDALITSKKAPFIQVLPVYFKYGVQGSYESWQTFGEWIYNLNKNRDELTDAEKQRINSLLVNVNNDLEKAKILYKYLQDYTRYINVTIDVGGLQTYPASYVCDNKYGDCKALTNYMQAMLKYVGIKSYYTLVWLGNLERNIDNDFPEQAFNHAILTLPINQDTLYLECTSKNTPFGHISTSIQGRKALLVDKENSKFVEIPTLDTESVKCTRKIKVDVKTNIVEIENVNRGSSYEYLNYLLENENRNSLEKYVRENVLTGAYELLNYKVDKETIDDASIIMYATCKMHDLYKVYGDNLVLKPLSRYIPAYELPEKRIQDVKIEYPKYYVDTIEYNIADYKISKIPENVYLESNYGKYSLEFKKDGDNLFVSKSILINAGEYSLDEYEGFFKFMSAVRNNEMTNYYIDIL